MLQERLEKFREPLCKVSDNLKVYVIGTFLILQNLIKIAEHIRLDSDNHNIAKVELRVRLKIDKWKLEE